MLPPLPILLSITLLFVMPLFLDVGTVSFGIRQPSNNLRFLTGLLFGQALSVYIYPAFITLSVAKACERSAIDSWRKVIGLTVVAAGAFWLKSLQHVVTFYILETLAVVGCLSLFAVIVWGLFKSTIRMRYKRKSVPT